MSVAIASTEHVHQDNGMVTGDAANPGTFAGIISQMRRALGADLARVDNQILEAVNSQVEMIPDLAGHLVNAGGKRLRPMLTLAAAHAIQPRDDRHIMLAAAVELIHGATLLHDDVVDASALRRGASTANVIWGNKESVLVGDYIFSRAFELMVSAGDLRVLKSLSHASGVIAEGEVLQLSTQKNLEATFDMYLAVISAKTAALFSAAAEAGAIVAGATDEQIDALKCYGMNLGIAYQLVDDALDYSGHELALGKRVGDDFREGKMTAPIVFSYETASVSERFFWERTIRDGQQKDGDLHTACELVESNGALERVFDRAALYTERAIDALSALPGSEPKDLFVKLAKASTCRSF